MNIDKDIEGIANDDPDIQETVLRNRASLNGLMITEGVPGYIPATRVTDGNGNVGQILDSTPIVSFTNTGHDLRGQLSRLALPKCSPSIIDLTPEEQQRIVNSPDFIEEYKPKTLQEDSVRQFTNDEIVEEFQNSDYITLDDNRMPWIQDGTIGLEGEFTLRQLEMIVQVFKDKNYSSQIPALVLVPAGPMMTFPADQAGVTQTITYTVPYKNEEIEKTQHKESSDKPPEVDF